MAGKDDKLYFKHPQTNETYVRGDKVKDVNRNKGTAGAPLVACRKPMPEGGFIEVTVEDPVFKNDHYKYRIFLRTNLPDFEYPKTMIKKRYSNFKDLAKRLSYLDSSLPSIPGKDFFGRYNKKILNERTQGFQKFLNAVCAQPALNRCPVFIDFFEQDWTRSLHLSQAAVHTVELHQEALQNLPSGAISPPRAMSPTQAARPRGATAPVGAQVGSPVNNPASPRQNAGVYLGGGSAPNVYKGGKGGPQNYGSPQRAGYGQPQAGYGSQQQYGHGASQKQQGGGYGGSQDSYGAPQGGYGGNQGGYGPPQGGGYGGPQGGGYGGAPPQGGGYGAAQGGGYGGPQGGGYGGAPHQGGGYGGAPPQGGGYGAAQGGGYGAAPGGGYGAPRGGGYGSPQQGGYGSVKKGPPPQPPSKAGRPMSPQVAPQQAMSPPPHGHAMSPPAQGRAMSPPVQGRAMSPPAQGRAMSPPAQGGPLPPAAAQGAPNRPGIMGGYGGMQGTPPHTRDYEQVQQGYGQPPQQRAGQQTGQGYPAPNFGQQGGAVQPGPQLGGAGAYAEVNVEAVGGYEAMAAAKANKPVPVPAAAPVAPVAEALYDFNGEDETECSFKKGQKVTILSRPSDEWWEGEVTDPDGTVRSGLFPVPYVKEL
eukprot:CAMPEP_0119155478 /NCGR_PEP_ID=MMETSP1310-20130426/51769_1 /TAXON_ID=464262 /ORGANISM="Genus nov. species nov., Strain RCC2339" /LENGTH=642 /DNA_ID=CAMNT_0007148077 /DNA_START=59 /DNA_END=1987 /DNA_ORIENTATION=-